MGTLSLPTIGEAVTNADPKIKTALETLNNLLDGSNLVLATKLAGEIPNTKLSQSKFTWYTPKVIATEQTRENTAFGTFTTADQITEVVLPENGLILVGYSAKMKSSISSNGRVALFIGANQLKTPQNAVNEAIILETGYNTVGTTNAGIASSKAEEAFVTTGQILGGGTSPSAVLVFAAAGTYTVSVQVKASSGSVTAKERKLWVATLGA